MGEGGERESLSYYLDVFRLLDTRQKAFKTRLSDTRQKAFKTVLTIKSFYSTEIPGGKINNSTKV